MMLFWVLAIVLVFSAIFTITARQPVHSVIGVLVNFTTLAVMYISLSAEFIGVIQVVVYSGAILVLFVFVIALLSSGVKPFDAGPNRLPYIMIPAMLLAAVSFGLVVWSAWHMGGVPSSAAAPPASGPVGSAQAFGSVADFGRALFGPYALPFEVTSLILMVAVIGVVILAGEVKPPPRLRSRERARESIVKSEAR